MLLLVQIPKPIPRYTVYKKNPLQMGPYESAGQIGVFLIFIQIKNNGWGPRGGRKTGRGGVNRWLFKD